MSLNQTQLTNLHRRQQLALRRVVLQQMASLWPALRWAELDASFPTFAAATAAMVTRLRRVSTGLAAAYLRAVRTAAGRTGDVKIALPDIALEQLVGSLHATSVAAAKKHSMRGEDEQTAMPLVLGLASGAMARHVLNGGRETIGATLQADPQSQGWRRVLGGVGCDFCQGLAGTEYPPGTTDFECHDRCGCGMEPIF